MILLAIRMVTIPLLALVVLALGWAMFVVAFVLSLCRAAARGDRAIVRRRMLGCHHRWLDETPEGRRLGTDKDYCVFCHKSRSELRQSQGAARGDRALARLRQRSEEAWMQRMGCSRRALDAANRRR